MTLQIPACEGANLTAQADWPRTSTDMSGRLTSGQNRYDGDADWSVHTGAIWPIQLNRPCASATGIQSNIVGYGMVQNTELKGVL